VTLLAGCPRGGAGTASTTGGRTATGPTHDANTRLVVLLVIDQLPEWAFEAKRSQLSGGFARLLGEGEWRVGHHPSLATATAPGHTLLGTGQTPSRSGIISNEWWSRDENRTVTATSGVDDQPSSRFLRVPGLADALAASPQAKAVGVAMKIRAARLPLGHKGLAIYYDSKTGTWNAHGGARPTWLDATPVPLAPWTASDPAQLATLSGTDDAQRGEVGEKGFGPTYPHDPSTTKNPYEAVFAMPLGMQSTFDTALAAIDGEHLGTDAATDLLVVSLSAHDYIAHGWGHESWEAWDATLQLDAMLAAFLGGLDERVGKGRWAMVVTSDHGGAPLPERANGGRYSEEQIMRAANAAASTVLGPGDWIASASWPFVTLSRAANMQNKKELTNAYRKIVFALRSFPGLALADRTDAYAGSCQTRTGDARAICLAIDIERAGEFVYAPKRGWIIEEEDERLATAHGSLHDYDRDVPVILLPFGRTAHAPQAAPGADISLSDIAALVASWLGVPPPH
jgi:hypothetical protein